MTCDEAAVVAKASKKQQEDNTVMLGVGSAVVGVLGALSWCLNNLGQRGKGDDRRRRLG